MYSKDSIDNSYIVVSFPYFSRKILSLFNSLFNQLTLEISFDTQYLDFREELHSNFMFQLDEVVRKNKKFRQTIAEYEKNISSRESEIKPITEKPDALIQRWSISDKAFQRAMDKALNSVSLPKGNSLAKRKSRKLKVYEQVAKIEWIIKREFAALSAPNKKACIIAGEESPSNYSRWKNTVTIKGTRENLDQIERWCASITREEWDRYKKEIMKHFIE